MVGKDIHIEVHGLNWSCRGLLARFGVLMTGVVALWDLESVKAAHFTPQAIQKESS